MIDDTKELEGQLTAWLQMLDWEDSQEYLQAHPHLLTEQAEQVLEQLKSHLPQDETSGIFGARQALLHDVRIWGIQGTYSYYQLADQLGTFETQKLELLLQQVQEWLNTPTWEQSHIYLEAHPQLRTYAAEAIIARLWQMEQADDERTWLAQHLQILQRTPVGGSIDTFYEQSADTLNTEGLDAIQRYQIQGNIADLHLALDCWQQALMLVTPEDPNRPLFLNNLGGGLHERYARTGNRIDLEAAISYFQQAVNTTPPDAPDRPARLNNLATGLSDRYSQSGDLADLLAALHTYQQALDTTPLGDPDRAAYLSNLGAGLHDYYIHTGVLADLASAISAYQQALDIGLPEDPNRPLLLNNLGIGLHERYARTGAQADLEDAISAFQQATETTPPNAPVRPAHLSNLGNGLSSRYARTGALVDLEAAIKAFQQALDCTPPQAYDRPVRLNNLGGGLKNRYARTRNLTDLEAAIHAFQQAVDTVPAEAPIRAAFLSNLSNALRERYARTKALVDLEGAISASQQAVDSTSPGAPDRPMWLNNLGTGLSNRYACTGNLTDLEAAIRAFQQALEGTPLDAPHRPTWLSNLGSGLYDRYTCTGNLTDLETAIRAFQQALEGKPIDAPHRPVWLINLGNALHTCYARTRTLADLEAAFAAWEASWAAQYTRFVSLPVLYQLGQQRQEGGLATTLVTAYLEKAQHFSSSKTASIRRALEVAEANKSRLLTQLVGRGPLPLPPGLSAQIAFREQGFLSDLTLLDTQELAGHEGSPADLNLSSDLDRLQHRQSLLKELEHMWSSIAQLGPEGIDYVALRRGDSPTWQDLASLAKRLGPQTALLSLFITPARILIFLLRAGWRRPHVLESLLDQPAWDTRLRQFLEEVSFRQPVLCSDGVTLPEASPGTPNRFFGQVSSLFPSLSRPETWEIPLLVSLKQAQRHLPGIERLIVAPAGNAHFLPWGVLAEQAKWCTPTGEPLPVVMLPALGVLPRLRQRPSESRGGALVVGNPLGDLPHAKAEATAVAERFGTTPLLGAAATKSATLSGLKEASLVHLATHAFFDSVSPLDSGVVLVDGVLTAREVLQQRLHADLLVLSACESGQVGSLGGEELAGLSQAFLQAGVRSLLVSLWRVDDPATAALMHAFYAARHAGADKAGALRQAMTVIQRDPHWRHPHYWGAFVLMGDWE